MNQRLVSLLLVLLLLSAGCQSQQEDESPSRDQRPTSDPNLSLADLAYLRSSEEVRQAKLRMVSPEEAFRLYLLDARENDFPHRMEWYLAEKRPDLVTVVHRVLLDSTSTMHELFAALGLVVSFEVFDTYDVIGDDDLMAAILSAEARVVANTNLPKQWSEHLAETREREVDARSRQE